MKRNKKDIFILAFQEVGAIIFIWAILTEGIVLKVLASLYAFFGAFMHYKEAIGENYIDSLINKL